MTSTVQIITVDAASDGQRIDNYLIKTLKGVPRSMVYRLLRTGQVRVNKGRAKPEYKLREGDQVRIPPVRVAERESVSPSARLRSVLDDAILYEDDGLMIINKPAGLAVHGGSGVSLGVIESLRAMRPQARFLELVHRLDRDTSGCLMVAKKRSVLVYLHQALQTDQVGKFYQALVAGRWPARRRWVTLPLNKNTLRSGERVVRVDVDGKSAKTEYRVLEGFDEATLVEAHPWTGRTHQIRVHCQGSGSPILGDPKYRDEYSEQVTQRLDVRRLFLHAWRLELTLPDGRPLVVEAPLPDELQEILQRARQRSAEGA